MQQSSNFDKQSVACAEKRPCKLLDQALCQYGGQPPGIRRGKEMLLVALHWFRREKPWDSQHMHWFNNVKAMNLGSMHIDALNLDSLKGNHPLRLWHHNTTTMFVSL